MLACPHPRLWSPALLFCERTRPSMDGRPPWLRDGLLGQCAGTVGKEIWSLGLERRVPRAPTVECQTAQGIHEQDQGAAAQGRPTREQAPLYPSPATQSHQGSQRYVCLPQFQVAWPAGELSEARSETDQGTRHLLHEARSKSSQWWLPQWPSPTSWAISSYRPGGLLRNHAPPTTRKGGASPS